MSTVKFDNNGKEIFALIDSHALIHRAYHAYPSTLTTVSGEQVNAVYGFTSMLFNVLETIKPTYIACAFDLPKPTFRHLEYVGYKKDRPKSDEALKSQFERVKQVVQALNIPIFAVEGYEADDVIGTLCRQIDELDPKNQVNTIIVTGDKDALQLVDENTKVWLPGKTFKDMKLYGIKEVEDRFGLKPKQIIDLKALAGDPSDQIPGVKGVGDKGAVSLLQEFETVEGIYKNLDNIPSRYKKKLIEGSESATMSKHLATIITDVPITLNYEESLLSDYNVDDVIDLFQELQFRSLIKKLPESSRSSKNKHQINMFNNISEKNEQLNNYKELKDINDVSNLVKKIKEKKVFSFYLWCDEDKDSGLISFFIEGNPISFVLDFSLFKESEIVNLLVDMFSEKSILKVGYDIKQSYHILSDFGIKIQGPVFDNMLAAYLLGFIGGNLELKSLVFSELGIVISDKKNVNNDSSKSYCSIFSKANLDLKTILEKKLEKEDEKAGEIWDLLVKGRYEKLLSLPDYQVGVKDLFYKIELPLLKILIEMESNGILADEECLISLKNKFDKKITNLEKEIYEIVGHEFNIASSRQLADILFEELQLPPVKKTKTGFSTAAPVLEELRSLHPIIEPIEKYRELTKLVSTYIDGLIPLIKNDGKIHTTYNQAIAVSGRLSSSNPNLQNIPVRTETGNEIRKSFIAPDDGVFVSIDYSQIELRLAAHVAGEEKMLEAFRRGVDVHSATAVAIFDVPLSDVTKSQRRVAKTVNFAVLYGVSSYGLSQQMDVTPEEAGDIIDRYFSKYTEIHNYIDRTINLAIEKGLLETMFGRRALIRNINSKNYQLRKSAQRFSVNFPMQGSAADIMKLSMIEAYKGMNVFLKSNNNVHIKMLLQIHDEIVFQYSEKNHKRGDLCDEKGKIKSDTLKLFIKEMENIMENIIELTVPLTVETEIGFNLGELEVVSN